MRDDSSARSSVENRVCATFRSIKVLPSLVVAVVMLAIFMTFNLWVARMQAGPAALAIHTLPPSQTPGSAFPVWVSPSLTRVGKNDAPGSASSITLSSARGETVDTQVIVHA